MPTKEDLLKNKKSKFTIKQKIKKVDIESLRMYDQSSFKRNDT